MAKTAMETKNRNIMSQKQSKNRYQYKRRPFLRILQLINNEDNDEEIPFLSFDPNLSHSIFCYAGDEDEELLRKHLRTFILKRFLKSLEVR
jgi:hypothetical protein